MAQAATPSYSSDSKIISVSAEFLVRMRDAGRDFVDQKGLMGLGTGDLIDLKLPRFQRGLKWNDDRLADFHDSLVQGWPIGVLVMAVVESQVLNEETGQRRITLSLIDGQQRSWALSRLICEFWSTPWITFRNEADFPDAEATGPIVGASRAMLDLGVAIDVDPSLLEMAVREVTKRHGRDVLSLYTDFLDELVAVLGDFEEGFSLSQEVVQSRQVGIATNSLCQNLLQQEEALRQVEIPVLLLGESLQPQLPTIFRRLNEGVPLKGYDLLAALWESDLLTPSGRLSKPLKDTLQSILAVAGERIPSSYESDAGYEMDANAEAMSIEELSLFDLLYFLGSHMLDNRQSFRDKNGPVLNGQVLAFQVSALVFRGSIGGVDQRLREVFPRTTAGLPDTSKVIQLFGEAASTLDSALKPMMDVTISTVQLKGRIGLTAAVVYLAVILTHHNIVREDGARLRLERRGTSAEDRSVRAGLTMSSSERRQQLKKNLPGWFVLDALTSHFAGSRGYEHAAGRVWKDFRGTKPNKYLLRPANAMLKPAPLEDLLSAFGDLWRMETDVEKTPQRRRISDQGAILFRAAYLNAHVHDVAIDHIMPLKTGQSASKSLGEPLTLNHVANLMPLPESVNSSRNDIPWDTHFGTMKEAERRAVAEMLIVEPAACAESNLESRDSFISFLRARYKLLVDRALKNLEIEDWLALSEDERSDRLDGLCST